MAEEIQEIVKEYFNQQENNSLTLCIYEEKASNYIEWIYDKDSEDWVSLKPKKIRLDKGEYENGFLIEHKKFKTFSKKCHITELSFNHFMAIKASEYHKTDELTKNDVDNYIGWYQEEKNKYPDLKISEFNEILAQRKNKGGCLLSIIGFIGISTALFCKITGVI